MEEAQRDKRKKKLDMDIGLRLRNIRETLGYTQREFSKALHVSEDHYRKIESGGSGLTLEKFQILFDKYHIEPAYLIIGKSSMQIGLEQYLSQCSKEERDKLFLEFTEYVKQYVMK